MNAQNERLIMVVINHHLKRNARPQHLKQIDRKLAAEGLDRRSIQRQAISAKLKKK